MASGSIDAGLSEHPEPSSSSGLCEVPAIFLSHSGRQKPLVESLYNALMKVNHTAFFDQHSLPKGSCFPEHIITAARRCTLGVVVLSEDYVTSKWPMLELEILVQQRGSEAKVLPLFYKLKPEDLKSSENLEKWQQKWGEMATPEDVIKWKSALRALGRFNGEIYQQLTSEARYVKRVVESICKQVPSPLPYDMSEMIGYHRLATEIAGQFERLCGARHDRGACIVGLYREGGGGKTTICKAMVNFYSSEYLGKCHHLELPTNGSDMGIIVQKCKQALQVLVDLDDKLLRNAHDIGQVIELMKNHLVQHNVFLAIDNVWESSRETARKILKVGFSSESRILVTSRSEEVLNELFRVQSNACVGPLPALEEQEAFQIFQEAFQLGDLNSLASRRQLIDCVMERCKFNGTYHSLALKALGVHVKNTCTPGGWQHFDMSSTLKDISTVDLTEVDAVIRLTYDNLEERKKHVFLDIALLPMMRGDDGEVTLERACQLLSLLYKNQSPQAMIKELSLGGVLQLELDGRTGDTIIKVHDLLSDLAKREVASGSRFFVAGRSVEEIQWQELERVILNRSCTREFIKQLQQHKCPRLQVLDARGVEFLEGINMGRIPSLCVLKLYGVTLRSIQNWSAAALMIIEIAHVGSNRRFADTPLRILYRSSMRVLRLEGLAQLQMLRLDALQIWEEIKGLDTLLALRSLHVVGCFLRGLPDLSSLTRLDTLCLKDNKSMEEVVGLSPSLRDVKIWHCGALKELPHISGLTRLETLGIELCGALKRIPDLSSLTRLDTLRLDGKKCMEVVGLSPSLRDAKIRYCDALKELPDISGLTRLETFRIVSCGALKRIPDLRSLTRLDTLCLEKNKSMEEVVGLSPSLRDMKILHCDALKELPDISGLTRLETLVIMSCDALKRIPDLSSLTRLDTLYLDGKKCMEVVGLSPSLRDVKILRCDALKELPDISGLTRLETLAIIFCDALKRIPDLSSLTLLDTLCLEDNKSMEEVVGLSPSLRDVKIWCCGALKRIPDLRSLTRLDTLDLGYNEWMEEVVGLSPSLRGVNIWCCNALKELPDISGLTRLETLEIMSCDSLKRIPDLSSLTRLDTLHLYGNKSMEEVVGLSPSLRNVKIWHCGALKRFPDLSSLTRLDILCLDKERMEEVVGLSPSLRDVKIWHPGAMNLEIIPPRRSVESHPQECGNQLLQRSEESARYQWTRSLRWRRWRASLSVVSH